MDGLSAIILAAGRSRRMGRFKPLLTLGDATVVERVVGLYAAAGIVDIGVVAGNEGIALAAALDPMPVRCIPNDRWQAGMYTSVKAGVSALPKDCRGFFVHPVDIPLVRPATVNALVRAFEKCPDAVCHPSFDGRRGHPVLVPAALAGELLGWPGEGGLRAFWESWAGPVRDVAVSDDAVLMDLDTEADYQLLMRRLPKMDRPSPDACRVLMTMVRRVPRPVWQHCRAVAAVSVAITDALEKAGVELDADLVRSAALVHDIARGLPDHAATGANLLAELGYPRVAAVVAVHMDLPEGAESALDEAAILFLSDKLVVGNRPSDLDTRFARKMAKHGGDPKAAEATAVRRQAAEAVLDAVERLTGLGTSSLLADASRLYEADS